MDDLPHFADIRKGLHRATRIERALRQIEALAFWLVILGVAILGLALAVQP